MDGETEPNSVVGEKAEELVEPMDATPFPQQQTSPPSEESGETVAKVTGEKTPKEGNTEDNDDDVVLVGEEAPQVSPTPSLQDTPSTDCLKAASGAEEDIATAEMVSKTSPSPVSSNASAVAAPQKPPNAEPEPIVIEDEEDTEQKDASPSPITRGCSSASHSPAPRSGSEPDSDIKIASVTTLDSSSQKESGMLSAVNTPPHSEDTQTDLNLMITSVTSLQGGTSAIITVRTLFT